MKRKIILIILVIGIFLMLNGLIYSLLLHEPVEEEVIVNQNSLNNPNIKTIYNLFQSYQITEANVENNDKYIITFVIENISENDLPSKKMFVYIVNDYSTFTIPFTIEESKQNEKSEVIISTDYKIDDILEFDFLVGDIYE